MKNFNRGKLFLIKFLQVLFSILFLFALIFVVKWRIDSLYLNSISHKDLKIGVTDEFKKIRDEIFVTTGLKEKESVKPIVILDEDKENKKDKEENLNVNKITIPEGTNVETLGEILLSNNLIKDGNAYKYLVDDMQIENSIVPGTYNFEKGLTVREILAKISNTELKKYNINISEGATPNDVANSLKTLGVIKSPEDFVAACNNLGVTNFAPGEHEIIMPSKVNNIIRTLSANEENIENNTN